MGLTFTIWSNLKVFLHYIYNDSRPSLSEYLLNYVSTPSIQIHHHKFCPKKSKSFQIIGFLFLKKLTLDRIYLMMCKLLLNLV